GYGRSRGASATKG
ncbi:hypothetical protein CFC21_038757, partial [Triticum aestivum]